MLIELDVFSGRLNPRWKLDEFHSQKLQQLQSRLEVSSRAPIDLRTGLQRFLVFGYDRTSPCLPRICQDSRRCFC